MTTKPNAHTLAVLAVFLFGLVLPRLCVIGYYPFIDDSSYAFFSRYAWASIGQGNGLPQVGGLTLYPLLLSWCHALPGVPLVWLRLFDGLLAMFAGILFHRVLARHCRDNFFNLSVLLLYFLLSQHDQVIQAGFKNSIACSLIPFFLAFLVADSDRIRTSVSCWLAGVLVAIAILLREPFAIFSLLGFCAIWYRHGFANSMRYACGGLACAMFVLAILVCLRGDWQSIILHYSNESIFYALEAGKNAEHFMHYGWRAICIFAGLVFCGLFSLYLLFRKSRPAPVAIFWLLCTLAPLLEPAFKFGFLYHFANCLPGLAVLAVLGWDAIRAQPGERLARRVLLSACWIGIVLACIFLPNWQKATVTLRTLGEFPQSMTWPDDLASESSSLAAGKAIRANLPPKGSLACSGFAFQLYEAANALPPLSGPFEPRDSFHFADLSRVFIYLGRDEKAMARAIAANPPQVLALAFTDDVHAPTFYAELTAIVQATGLYEKVLTIPAAGEKNYGWMGIDIYRQRGAAGS